MPPGIPPWLHPVVYTLPPAPGVMTEHVRAGGMTGLWALFFGFTLGGGTLGGLLSLSLFNSDSQI